MACYQRKQSGAEFRELNHSVSQSLHKCQLLAAGSRTHTIHSRLVPVQKHFVSAKKWRHGNFAPLQQAWPLTQPIPQDIMQIELVVCRDEHIPKHMLLNATNAVLVRRRLRFLGPFSLPLI